MKKILSMIVTGAMVMALFSGTAFADPGNGNGHGNNKQMKEFKDMKGHWGYQSVQKMQNYGIFDGYSDGTFKPDNTLTQGELAVLISRIMDLKQGNHDQDLEDDQDLTDDDEDLADVPAWAKDAVHKGFQKHYLNAKRFHSQEQCKRLYAVVTIAKALEEIGELEPVTDLENYPDNPFKDRVNISDEDYGYLLALYEEGYIKGFPDGNFNPNYLLSRAQMAAIIEKLLDKLDTSDSNDDNAPTWDNDSAVTASAIKATSVNLKWTTADDDVKVTGYKVLYKVDGDQKSKTTTEKTLTISGLAPDEVYTFTVEAKDAAGNWSDDGPSVEVTTDKSNVNEDSDKPTWDNDSTVTATAIRSTSVDLKWDAADDDDEVTGYKVSYKEDGDQKTKTTTGKTVTISGLTPDEKYTFTVKAKDAAGNWSEDNLSITVTTLEEDSDDSVPTWPEGASLTVSSSSSGVVTLIWPKAKDDVGIKSYKIYQDDELIKTLDSDSRNYNLTGLEEGTKYTFKVIAVDAAGNQSISLVRSYTAQ